MGVKRMEITANNGPIIMALSLNKARGKEHIVIGQESCVYSRLNGNMDANVLYDEERKLGEFLFSHEKHLDKDWNAEAIYPLRRALTSPVGRKKYEDASWRFLEEKENNCDPIGVFIANCFRKWYAELKMPLGSERTGEQFQDRVMGLTRSFKQIIWGEEKKYSIKQILERMERYTGINADARDMQARIWYPGKRRKAEYLIIENSYFPAIWYYLGHLRDWQLSICRCDICGNMFLSTSKHFSLCSAACRKAKNRQNKQEFDDRARKNKYDVDYKNTTQRMRNKLNKISKNQNLSEAQRAQIQTAFRSICKEALQQKKQIKYPEDYKAFVDLLFALEHQFETLCEDIINNGGGGRAQHFL